MKKWSPEDLERMFQEFTGPDDSQDPKVRKKQRIVQVATEHFIRHGYRKTSVDEIARDAGVAKGTVYLYFRSKAEIMVHAIVAEKKRYFGIIAPCFDPGADPREKLRLLIRSGFIMATAMPMTSRLMSGDREFVQMWNDLPPEFLAERMSLGHEFYRDFLAAATPGRDWDPQQLQDRAHVLMSLVYFSGMLTEEKIRMGLSVERIAAILADMIVDGVDGPVRTDGGSETASSHQGGQS